MLDLSNFFAQCFYVNLDRRPDRRQHMERDVMPAWPFAPLQRFVGIDGQIVPPPPWWQAGKGAWGIYRSHLDILERCLNEGVKSVLLLEDDAVLCPGFTEKAAAFLEAVPSDWGMIYLGGQHLYQQEHVPEQVNDLVFRPWNVNRCHAFAVSATGMPAVYRWLNRKDWKNHQGQNGQPQQDHIDHWLGRLHMTRSIPVYSPAEWLIAQGEGQSNICGQVLPVRNWKGAADVVKAPTGVPKMIAVLGPFRSGTSCVAGILHALGVSMGKQFWHQTSPANAKGFFEAKYLTQICQRYCKEPRMMIQGKRQERVSALRQWASGRRADGEVAGAKHPGLCMMVPAMATAWPGVKVVTVTRPLDKATESLVKTGWWPQLAPDQKRAMLERLLQHRDMDLKRMNVPTLNLNYEEVLADPVATVTKLIAFAGITPTPEQMAAAIAFVDPHLNHAKEVPCHQDCDDKPADSAGNCSPETEPPQSVPSRAITAA